MYWHDHIVAICNKADSTRAFLQRNLRQCSPTIKSLAYPTYVRPILEDASTVWSPYVRTDIAKLEMVQRKAARFVFNKFSAYSSVTSLLSQLNWQSLEVRRTNAIISSSPCFTKLTTTLFVLTSHKISNQYYHLPGAILKDSSVYLLELTHIIIHFSHIQFDFGTHYLLT